MGIYARIASAAWWIHSLASAATAPARRERGKRLGFSLMMARTCCSPPAFRLRGCPGRQRAPRTSGNIRRLARAARSAASPKVSRKVPGCPAAHCSPACLLAEKCTKWQKLSITPESNGPPGGRNDTTASGWEISVGPSRGDGEFDWLAGGRAGGGHAGRLPEPGGQEEGVPGAPGLQDPPAGLVPVRRGQLGDRQAPESGDPAPAVGEHGGPTVERAGHLGLGKAGGRGQIRRGDRRPAASSRYKAMATRCPAGSRSPRAVAISPAGSSRVLCSVS